ncbi:hypothetical protein A2316_03830 [Candidatus Falkowbacteria bacterium RIFOXYB2_FULL_38_15]|uniref:Uncharacterized protein n=1 Tax=Candidatus Falkowbacteria bacterium RIFOXYA2_FULL_38_12 TaxID=1797993 RepID=A0A1F5S1X7_9BACT|nr:MAG: hypothetical protein A2257_01285 [Candidatus Falkowbacteria bacterium RIFOXYA2_FULL_38_12]OGF32589.1 MAG: hypothetical protein A2316_03830 [Candidatus Falkowbacteria bacterium RIFOXYB2_FULL_38_15]OGF42111.1 MAG: hypothetical protein A2555_03335 [Candidatus Falkowbacteria bacterium RIFOXYD2_FULL_39_16]
MSQITKEELLNKIKALDIEKVKKDAILDRIQSASEVDNDLIDWLKSEVQTLIDNGFAQAGITDDENDPKYQAKFKEMMSEIDAAEDGFNQGIKKLEKEVDEVTADAAEQLDTLQAQAAKSKLVEA